MTNSSESAAFKSSPDVIKQEPDWQGSITEVTGSAGAARDNYPQSSSSLSAAAKDLPPIEIDLKGDQLAQGPSADPDDKTVRKGKDLAGGKLSDEDQRQAAKDIAGKIAEKGLTDRTIRDELRNTLNKVYTNGDPNSEGDEKSMNAFIEQINKNLPKNMSLKLAQPQNDPDYEKFLKGAQEIINKDPAMKMGAHGQIQLWKTENGKQEMLGKTHYAASLRKIKGIL